MKSETCVDNLKIPTGARPRWNMMTVNFFDKAKRGSGFNFKEVGEFGGICSIHVDQLINCYSCLDKELTRVELIERCFDCPYAINKARISKTRYTNRYPYFIEDIVDIEWEDPKYYVYLISDGEHIKIGMARNADERLRELQTGNPRQLELICAIPLKSVKDAQRLEDMLHKEYDEFYVRGEWYNILRYIHIKEFTQYFFK